MPVLDVVHQGVERDLEQVVARLAGRRELVVDDAVMRGPPVVEDVVERARDADRLAVRADLEGHVDPAAAVAEEVVDDLDGRLAPGPGVGHDVGQLAHVDLDGADERLLLRRPACCDRASRLTQLTVQVGAEPLLDGPGIGGRPRSRRGPRGPPAPGG